MLQGAPPREPARSRGRRGPLPCDTARAMSQENVEIVRAVFEAWNARDMDASPRALRPRRHRADRGGLAGAGALVGREAVMRFLRATPRHLGCRHREYRSATSSTRATESP